MTSTDLFLFRELSGWNLHHSDSCLLRCLPRCTKAPQKVQRTCWWGTETFFYYNSNQSWLLSLLLKFFHKEIQLKNDHCWEFPGSPVGLSPFNTGARVQSLVRELRSRKLRSIARHKQTNKNDHCIQMVTVILLITLQLSEFQYPCYGNHLENLWVLK